MADYNFKVGDIIEVVGRSDRWNGTRFKALEIVEGMAYGIVTYKGPENSHGYEIGDKISLIQDGLALWAGVSKDQTKIQVGDYVETTLIDYKALKFRVSKITGHKNNDFKIIKGVITYSAMASYKVGQDVSFYLKDLKKIQPPKKVQIFSKKGWGPS